MEQKRDCPHYPNEDPSKGCKIPNEPCPKGYGTDCNIKKSNLPKCDFDSNIVCKLPNVPCDLCWENMTKNEK